MENIRHSNSVRKKSDRIRFGGILKSVAAALCIAFLLFSLYVLLIQKGVLKEETIGTVSKLLWGAAILIGSLIAAKQAERGKLPFAMLTAGVCFALLAGIAACANRGGEISWIKLLIVTAGCGAVGGAMGSKRKQFRYK